MARAKIIKKQGRCFVELPKEFLNNDEIEFFELREGYYLLSIPLPVPGVQKDKTQDSESKTRLEPTAEEIAVLRKLQTIKFSNRIPEYVNKVLTDPEKLLLKEMGKKGWVNVFQGRKYKNGVYNIADKVYPLLKTQDARPKTAHQQPETQDSGQETRNRQRAAGNRSDTGNYSLLLSQGYLIIRDQRDAKALSEKLKSEMKSGSVLGVKGFDGAFYVVTKDYFSKASKTILGALKEEADVQSITENCKLETDGVQAVLRHLAESGEVIEKKRGVYAAV